MITRDVKKDVELTIQLINDIQKDASNWYWKELFGNTAMVVLTPFRFTETALLTLGAAVGCAKAAILPEVLAAWFVFSLVSAYEHTDDEITEARNKMDIHYITYLCSNSNFTPELTENLIALNNVIHVYKIDWKINLKDFKSLLTEINQLNKHQTSWFFSSSKTEHDILCKYKHREQMTSTAQCHTSFYSV